MYKSGLNESDTIHRILNRKNMKNCTNEINEQKMMKISISHVEMKMKIVALKINS